jgi:hypothetical protein
MIYCRTQMSVPLEHGGRGFDSTAFVKDNNESVHSSSSSVSLDDEFTKLKSEREKKRKEKALQKLSRSISNRITTEPSSLDMNDTEMLLSELASTSRRYLHPTDCEEKEQQPPNSN